MSVEPFPILRNLFYLLISLGLILGSWKLLAPSAPLDRQRFESLTRLGQFDQAEALLKTHLQEAPEDGEAHFLLAQLVLERPDGPKTGVPRSEASRALDHLREARPSAGVPAALIALYRGKALYHLRRWDQAEAAWLEALRLDPKVPEAGWGLLDLYYLEGRRREARDLGLRLLEAEPDPRDRAQLLLELIRQDAVRPDPVSLVKQFEPVAQEDPEGVHSCAALGLSMIRSSQVEKGLVVLRELVSRQPSSEIAWDALLTGLDNAPRPDEFLRTMDQLPVSMARLPEFASHNGRAAELRRDWPAAIVAYRRGLQFDPADFETAVRLARVLGFAKQVDEANALERRIAGYRAASKELLQLFEQADAVKTLGVEPHPDLIRQLAENRDRMWRSKEAQAWRRMSSEIAR